LPRARDALEIHGLHGYEEFNTAQDCPYGKIWCAPIFFQRLKHMAGPKCNARYDGDMDPRTLQPTHGLAQGGGLRLGEMEVSALLSHGAADLVQTMLHDQSDGLLIPHCRVCNRQPEQVGSVVWCKVCRNRNNLVLRRVTFSLLKLENAIKMCGYKLRFPSELRDATIIHDYDSDKSCESDELGDSDFSDEDYGVQRMRYWRKKRGLLVKKIPDDTKQEYFDQVHDTYRSKQVDLESLPLHYIKVGNTTLAK